MNVRQIAAIALDNRDFPSLDAKLDDAVHWVSMAADSGAQLAVLPELLNRYCGDGPGNPRARPIQDLAFDDWQNTCRKLLDTAREKRIALTIPVLRREVNHLINCFFLVSDKGEILGEYQKRFLTPAELDAGVRPGRTPLIEWDGLKVGGAICFDTLFPQVFSEQADAGAQLFLVPSLWPGGYSLRAAAIEYSVPVVLAYPAWSRIIDADGTELAAGGHRWETLRFGFGTPIVMAKINFDRAAFYGSENQQQIAAIQQAYAGRVAIRFDQENVIFSIESICPKLHMEEVISRFGLVTRRAYLQHCLERQKQVR